MERYKAKILSAAQEDMLEIAEYLKTNRWVILNHLRKIQTNSKKQLGKPIITYYAGEKSGKKKAWWINQDIIKE